MSNAAVVIMDEIMALDQPTATRGTAFEEIRDLARRIGSHHRPELCRDVLPNVLVGEDQAGDEEGHGHERHGSEQAVVREACTEPNRRVVEP
jgi:hypothetical protein